MLLLGGASRRINKANMIAFASLSHIVYFAGIALAPNLWVLVPLQILNAVVVAVTSCLGMSYFQELMPGALARATTLFFNTMRTGSVLAGVASGFVAATWGYRAVFVFCVMLASTASIVLFILARATTLFFNTMRTGSVLQAWRRDSWRRRGVIAQCSCFACCWRLLRRLSCSSSTINEVRRFSPIPPWNPLTTATRLPRSSPLASDRKPRHNGLLAIFLNRMPVRWRVGMLRLLRPMPGRRRRKRVCLGVAIWIGERVGNRVALHVVSRGLQDVHRVHEWPRFVLSPTFNVVFSSIGACATERHARKLRPCTLNPRAPCGNGSRLRLASPSPMTIKGVPLSCAAHPSSGLQTTLKPPFSADVQESPWPPAPCCVSRDATRESDDCTPGNSPSRSRRGYRMHVPAARRVRAGRRPSRL